MNEKQKAWLAWGIVAVVLTVIAVALGVSFPVPPAPVGEEVEVAIGAQAIRYSQFDNVRVQHHLQVDEAGVVAGATTLPTGTPALVVDQAGAGQVLSLRDGGTEFLGGNDGGQVAVAGPTALATGSPAMVVDSSGLSNILEVRDSETPIAQFQDGGTLDLIANPIVQDISTENLMLPTVISVSVAYDAASGTVATIAAGEIWLIHAVYANVTVNFDCTGDDCTLNIGDGGDADGLLDLDDGELQAADTEGTGAPAGWQGFMSTDTRGAYLANGLGFIYNPGAEETIDWAVGGTSPAAGQAYVYVVYTRIK